MASSHAGRRATISRYSATQIRRLMHTIIALPGRAAQRFSKWSRMSCATSLTRFSAPTIASSRAHLVLSSAEPLPPRLRSPPRTLRPARPFVGRQLDLRQPAFVVDADRGPVLDGLLDVVNVDVFAEDLDGVLVSVSIGVPVKPMNEAFGRASRMWRAKPSMKSYWLRWASSAITTTLRSVGQLRVLVAASIRHEFLDRREDDAAGRHRQQPAQVGSIRRLHRAPAAAGPGRRQKVPKSCLSRSLRSVSMTMVGLDNAG